ncbi:GNAT superfamily N-acetyltransferase [Chitinophaga sp. W3I9]|uniref:GNAT family N-acetyltransferase n=1 Tax=unclassified Chitinophaga TaxID=2619133 RepID=UPI003D1A619B
MIFREATTADIPGLQRVRGAVKENVLNNPDLVTTSDYIQYLTTDGRGWLCESAGVIVGFAIVDTHRHNIWALFVDPRTEAVGVGRELQRLMLDWYFAVYQTSLWLGTSPGTRAERFYTRSGWKNAGLMKNGEVRFEMDRDTWLRIAGAVS